MQLVGITVNQLINMFFFMAIGYFFRKKNIFDIYAGGAISKLLVNAFLPAMVIRSFSQNFKLDVIADKLMIILLSCVVLLITGVLSIFLARIYSKDKSTQGIYMYSFTIPNLGYMGYPLIQAIFGESALLDTMIYCLPYNVYIYTIGMQVLTSRKNASILGMLLNPSIIATVFGTILGLADIQLPGVVNGILDTATACVSPCAMILTGTVFARIDMKSVFCDIKSYTASAIRLLAIPLVALLIFKLIKLPANLILPCVGILAMPLGVNSVVFPEAYGGDAESGAKVCFMSAILCLITIPIVFALL
ncbi:MAG: AEC family transporter [Oscillospiraceae bacterium]|nr:AEC family transporter [Oscillospiraceae bacterium]MBQ6902394.1 AEC family transporter [Oscillospiraceae bacterium]